MKRPDQIANSRAEDCRVVKAWERLNSEPQLTTKELANGVGLSASRLQHLITEQVGMTVRELKEMKRLDRLQKARQQLLETTVPMVSIRTDAGYKYDSNFIRDFKKLFGLSPAKCRRRGK
jgi:methylphosphotriester-DNA--protein-cysteine methyltransferase